MQTPIIPGKEPVAAKRAPGPNHPFVEFWDDEREIGNGIIVTLIPGKYFYDDCGVMGFDTVREAKAAILALAKADQRP